MVLFGHHPNCTPTWCHKTWSVPCTPPTVLSFAPEEVGTRDAFPLPCSKWKHTSNPRKSDILAGGHRGDILKESFATQWDWRNIIRERSYNYLLRRHVLGEMYAPPGTLNPLFFSGITNPPKYKIVMGEIDLQGIKNTTIFFCAEGAIFFFATLFRPEGAIFFLYFLGSKIRIWGGL